MQTIIYLLIAVAIGMAAWWALKVSVGMLLPIEKSAPQYFFQLTKKLRINQIIPAALADECVNESISSAKWNAKLHKRDASFIRMETVKKLELYVDMLRLWIHSADSFDDSSYKQDYKELFERHRVPRLNKN